MLFAGIWIVAKIPMRTYRMFSAKETKYGPCEEESGFLIRGGPPAKLTYYFEHERSFDDLELGLSSVETTDVTL